MNRPMDQDLETEEKESVYLQQMYKSLLSPGNTISLGSVPQSQPTLSALNQSQSTLSALSQSQTTLAALNRIQSRSERDVKPEPTLSPSSIEETVRIIKTNGTKATKAVPKTKILKTKQVSVQLFSGSCHAKISSAKAQISLVRAFTLCEQNHWILQNI